MVTREQELVLVRAAADGDEQAFEELMRLESPRATAVAWRLTRDPAAAAEIVQEAFVRLHRSLSSLRSEARVSTWLYRAVINLCHDRRRSATRQARVVSIEEAGDMASADQKPDDAMESEDRRQPLDAAVQALPTDMREAVVLRYVRGLNYDEIAAVLECPAGTVASRIHRALRMLGTLLEQQGIREGSL